MPAELSKKRRRSLESGALEAENRAKSVCGDFFRRNQNSLGAHPAVERRNVAMIPRRGSDEECGRDRCWSWDAAHDPAPNEAMNPVFCSCCVATGRTAPPRPRTESEAAHLCLRLRAAKIVQDRLGVLG